jgi:hypothetical protein
MSWTESLICWFKPSHWRDHRRLTVAERSNASPADAPHGYTGSEQSAADMAEPDLHGASDFTDHDVSDPGVT